MAAGGSTPGFRLCATCGAKYLLNPKYSAAQVARSKYCSPRCSGRAQDHAKRSMEDLLGGLTRFGRLTFIMEGDPTGATRRGLFRCDCGAERLMALHHIKAGKTVSCGCYAAEDTSQRFTKHGGYLTSEYKSWNAMIQRCTNPNNTSWHDYGGRGISVCPEWQGAEGYHQFVRDLGPRPRGMTLDRISSHNGYSPDNTRWATPKVQQNNRRITKMLTFNGETLSQAEWTQRLGMSRNAISERLRKGWSIEKALGTPPGNSGPKPQ